MQAVGRKSEHVASARDLAQPLVFALAGPSGMKLHRTLGLRGRLILLLLMAFAALASLLAWRFAHDRDDRISAARAELLGQTRLMAARQESLLERADAILNGLLVIPEPVPGSSAEQCAQFLAARLKREPIFSQIGEMRPNGDVTCTAVPGPSSVNGADRAWFQQTLQAREMIVSDAVISRTLGKPVITLAKAMRDADERVTSVFYLSLGLDWLEREFAKTQLPEGARLTVVDGRGTVTLRYPDGEAWTGKSAGHLPIVQRILAEGGEGTLEGTGLGGELKLFAHTPLFVSASGSHYYLLLAIPKEVIEAPARRDSLLDLGAVLAVLIATMGWVVVDSNRLLLRPLLTLSRTATRLKAGDLGARSGLPHGDDEIGRLAATLDETAAAIQDRDTERGLAEQALRASEVQYRRLFEAAKDGILIIDADTGMIVDVNPFLINLLGYSHEAFLRKKLWEVGFFNDIVASQANFEELQEKGYIRYENKALETADGRRIEVEFVSNVYLVNDHKVIQCNIRDMTDHKHAQENLRRSEVRFRSIFGAVSEGIFIVSPTGSIAEVNEASCAMFGYTAAEMVCGDLQTISSGVPPYTQHDAMKWIEQAMATGRPQRFEWHCKAKDGRLFWAEVSILFTSISDQETVLATVRDVTERKTAEEQLRQAQKMEAVGNLTGGMAHDFNNLLGIIIGNLDLLRDRQSGDPDAEELSREALDAALRGADLTRRLLAFARRQPLQPAKTDVNELIAGIVKLLERTLGEQIQITLDLNPATWPVVVDPAQLESGLTNLATNARDAMPGGGQLIIVTGNRSLDADYAAQHAEVQPGDYALIEVSDTGTGMPPEVATRIFEPFYTTKEPGKGTGLGLSMVFGFIKQSGGHINVYSEVGIGTIFRLYLPRAAIGAEASPAIVPAALLHGSGETVLAVEDNASLRRVVARQLTELGYRVLEATDAQMALGVIEGQPVDVLFTDIVMPGGTSGYELARAVLSRWPAIKIVLTSGFPENRTNGEADAPNLRLLSKPYRRDELGRVIREILDS
jgi:PAS domain S-box-containing protein